MRGPGLTRRATVKSHPAAGNRRADGGARVLTAVDRERSAQRPDPILESSQARAPTDIRAADPVIGDFDDRAVAGAGDGDRRPRCARVLRNVGQCLRHEVVRGDLDGLRQPPVRDALDHDWKRSAPDDLL
jgi:hypothetical protein